MYHETCFKLHSKRFLFLSSQRKLCSTLFKTIISFNPSLIYIVTSGATELSNWSRHTVYFCFLLYWHIVVLSANIVYGLSHSNNMDFSTYDLNQDTGPRDCAQIYHSAWWFYQCGAANPNGMYTTRGTYNYKTMHYYAFRANPESLRTMKLMFR